MSQFDWVSWGTAIGIGFIALVMKTTIYPALSNSLIVGLSVIAVALVGLPYIPEASRPSFVVMGFAAIGVVALAIAAHFYFLQPAPAVKAGPSKPVEHDVVAPMTQGPAFGGLSEAQQRELLLQQRASKEAAMREAAGTVVVFDLDNKATETISIGQNGSHKIRASIGGAMIGYIYPADDTKAVYVIKDAVAGTAIDIRNLRPIRNGEGIFLGQRAIYLFSDGSLAQLLLVSVQYYQAGDSKDEMRFKYKVYPPGNF